MKRLLSLILTLSTLAVFFSSCTQDKPEDTTSQATTQAPFTTAGTEPVVDENGFITTMRVNYEKNPSGVDSAPNFSWVMESENRGMSQTAYRIKVAASADLLKSGTLVWDSGTVKSDASILIPCTAELTPATKYYWGVDVTTAGGVVLSSDEDAYFTTGLMTDNFNGADWIIQNTNGTLSSEGGFDGANWIWLMKGEAFGSNSPATQYFRAKFTSDTSKTVEKALLYFTADDYGTVYINGKEVGNAENLTDGWKSGHVVTVTSDIISGENLLSAKIVNSAVGYGGFICKLFIKYTDGSDKTVVTNNKWLVTEQLNSDWNKPEFDDSAWQKPDQCRIYGSDPWYENVSTVNFSSSDGTLAGAPMMRTEFDVSGDIASAKLFATAAGLYEVYINGTEVGADFLNPGRSEFPDRIMYQSFDVTSMLKSGKNAIGAMLGRGWYLGAYSPYNATVPAFLCKMIVEYKDGTKKTVVSDGNWMYTLDGPVTYNDIFNGENYDATREISGWCEAGFDASKWNKVEVASSKALNIGEVEAQLSGTVKAMDRLTPISVTRISNGKYIYDFGQNFAGVVGVTLKGNKGDKITLRHAEMLNDGSAGSDGKKGTLYTKNLRTAAATDTYILKGSADGETYIPTFTFHGFRYVEISGISEELPLESVVGYVLYSDMENSGTLKTSSELLNKLISNTYWGQRSNFLSTPTDCPQRDERMGWSGDAQIFVGTAAYNMNVKTFFDKYITDLNDCQRSDGAYSDVAPQTGRSGYSGAGNSAWGDAGIIIPWIMYTTYGDISYIQKYYRNMSKYITFLVNVSTNFIKANSAYGDWLSIGESTPVGVTDTAYCAYVCDLMSKMATILGKESDAEKFASYCQKFKDAWCKKFLKESGALTANSQTAYVVALRFDLIPEQYRAACAEFLNKKIASNGYKLTTGFIGVKHLLPVLCEYGYYETAFKLLEQTAYPSWLYPVLQGATTIWERWNSYTLESGFGDAGMNSFNHYSYGAVVEWMYSYMAGIACDEKSPGYKHFLLKPLCGGTLTSVEASYESMYGTIKSAWTGENSVIKTYTCTVPANTTATLTLRISDTAIVKEGNSPLEASSGLTVTSRSNGILIIELTSGSYSFTIN